MSLAAFSFFQSKAGFAEGTPGDLPPARRARYEQSGRRSKVLVKKLMQTQNDTLARRELDYASRLKVTPVSGAIDLF